MALHCSHPADQQTVNMATAAAAAAALAAAAVAPNQQFCPIINFNIQKSTEKEADWILDMICSLLTVADVVGRLGRTAAASSQQISC
jgi:hypothetical protein